MTDLHQNILNVRTPPGESEFFRGNGGAGRLRRDNSFQRTYRKDLDTPPLTGGIEPRTYFRDNTVLLGDRHYSDNLFASDLQREANERQVNRLSLVRKLKFF